MWDCWQVAARCQGSATRVAVAPTSFFLLAGLMEGPGDGLRVDSGVLFPVPNEGEGEIILIPIKYNLSIMH